MNREIKFRAWDDQEREMIYLGSRDKSKVATYFKGENLVVEVHRNRQNYEQLPVMQYTSLKDKNGKDIYEGDINSDDSNKKSEIVFYAGGFYLKYSDTDFQHIGGTAPFDRNVVGNIYGNPELLNN